MKPEKVDALLAAKVAREAREHKAAIIAEYATTPSIDLILVLKARGYRILPPESA